MAGGLGGTPAPTEEGRALTFGRPLWQHASVDDEIRSLIADGRSDVAAERILRTHGPAIYGLLVGLHGSMDEADEVFSVFSERLWRSLERFRGECSTRSWSYRIARAASVDHRRVSGRRRAPLVSESPIARLAAEVRTETATYLRTERRTALQALRDALGPEDQLILVLRVDRGLAWNELAAVTLAESEAVDDATALKRESARLRQRFKSVKARLKRLATERGLIDR